MRLNLVLTATTSIFLAATAYAEGISIDPGQWEMTSTMTMSMMPQPQTTVVKECIEEEELNLETFKMDKDDSCEPADVTFEDNTVRWSINCPTPEGQVMKGQWEMTSHGDSLSGKGAMSTEFSGQKMSFDMTWKGKRIGACEK